MTSNRQVVAVRSQSIAPCMTCPICNKLFKNATTITECLHTFCRKCIYDKINEEELNTCPVCNVNLGCTPLEKLRADHSLQDIRAAIFGALGRRGSKKPESGPSDPLLATIESREPEVVPAVPLPSRRKERSLSSLVSQPKASNQTAITGRKKYAARKVLASRGSALSIEEPTKEEKPTKDKEKENSPESPSPPVALTKITQNKKQNSFPGESSKQHLPRKDAEDPVEPLEGMPDQWKSLNCLVEAAGITNPDKSIVQGSVAKSGPSIVHEDEENVNKITKLKERANKSKVNDDEGGPNPVPSSSAKPKKIRRGRQKRAMASEGTKIAPQAVVNAAVNAASNTSYKRVQPTWFSLIASDAQDGDAPLPQLPFCYLMMNNGDAPVSSIQKYVVNKLDLNCSEAEVEITLKGQPLPPTLRVYKLIDLWLQTVPKSEKIKTTVGSSAKDFVMLLHYGWKPQPS